MAWDIPFWLGVLLACGDACIAFGMGYHFTPRKARHLIMDDPLFKKLEQALENNTEQLASAKTDLLAVRHDMEVLRKGLHDELKALPKPDLTANITLPVTMQDAVQRDIRAVARAVMKEVVTSDLEGLLDKAIEKAMQKRLAPESAAEADRLADEAELSSYLEQLAQAYGIPGPVVTIAKRMGKAAIPWLDARYQLGLQEVSR